jgi:pantetheine-phosphate adenylyltransferase
MTRVALGGTFEVIHRGHRALLLRAFTLGDDVLIGLTTDQLANSMRDRMVTRYRDRLWALEEYISRNYPLKEFVIQAISNEFGPADHLDDLDVLVVSQNTEATGHRINVARESKGLHPLRIVTVPHVLAEDGRPVSSTRILDGEIDEEGRLLR